jgi:hypothetical protein
MFLFIPSAPAGQKILSQILNKIYVPSYPLGTSSPKDFMSEFLKCFEL